MSKPFIVIGDKTSHGGVVIEGSPTNDIDGKGIARVGDKVTCPKKGCHSPTTIVVSGDVTIIIDGKPVALHGDKTACGATLISSQFNTNSDPNSGGSGGAGAAGNADNVGAKEVADNQAKSDAEYDEQLKLLGPDASAHEGLPYRIETNDGRVLTGTLPASGHLPRVGTDKEDTYHVYWGDEALAKEEA